jgi:hypothetical protein
MREEQITAARLWTDVMGTGRLCRCGHTEVCHWNGENTHGQEGFAEACISCHGSCAEFRDSGRRRNAATLSRRSLEDVVEVEAEELVA